MNSKQRAMLRGMASKLEPYFWVGKEGIVPGTIQLVDECLEANELVKGGVQPNCPLTAKEALTQLCEALHAEPVQYIGRRFVLYRPSEEDPRIVLP